MDSNEISDRDDDDGVPSSGVSLSQRWQEENSVVSDAHSSQDGEPEKGDISCAYGYGPGSLSDTSSDDSSGESTPGVSVEKNVPELPSIDESLFSGFPHVGDPDDFWRVSFAISSHTLRRTHLVEEEFRLRSG